MSMWSVCQLSRHPDRHQFALNANLLGLLPPTKNADRRKKKETSLAASFDLLPAKPN